MARTSSIYHHFDLYLTLLTLIFNLPKNVSNGSFPPRWQQLCKIILKSVHKCTSYGADKLNRDKQNLNFRRNSRDILHLEWMGLES